MPLNRSRLQSSVWVWLSTGSLVGMLLCGASVLARGQVSDSDRAIVSDIDSKLFQDSVLKTRDIKVSCENGVVTLTGTVNTNLEKAAVDRIASTEKGVKQVVDSLAVSGPSPTVPAVSPNALAPSAQSSGGLTVPAGTVVTVRMIDSIDTSRNRPGEEFDATVDSPVAVGDKVVIPRNSNARIRLVNAQSAGRIKGQSAVQLELITITVNGTPYNVQSGSYEQHGKSRGKRTAETVGGGAVLGGLIGAIAGGGKGAAIGAGAGAAAGGGVQAATHGEQVKIPSETKLDFTLKSPVTVNP